MPALNFPDNPAENATYTNSETGVVYVYKNGAWRTASNETNLDDVYVQVSGDNMTGPLTIGPEGGTALTTLDDDGSASFAGNIEVNHPSNGVPIFTGKYNNATTTLIYSNGACGLATNKFNINANGNLTTDGSADFTGNVATPGVVFGTASGNAISKTLDDYEEGTFTITTEGGYVLNTETAHYTKIGNVVVLTGKIRFSQVGANTSVIIFRGIPFQASGYMTPGMARESSSSGYVYVFQVFTGQNIMSMNPYDGVNNGTHVFEAEKDYVFSVSFFV